MMEDKGTLVNRTRGSAIIMYLVDSGQASRVDWRSLQCDQNDDDGRIHSLRTVTDTVRRPEIQMNDRIQRSPQ